MNIKLALYDFDGVMTDNTVLVNENGEESLRVNRSDGLAVGLISDMGINQFILSTENNKIVSQRALKLGIECFQALENKLEKAKEISIKYNVTLEETCFIGNDINDLEVMKAVGYSICPSDATGEVKAISNIILNTPGGSGVIREFFELISNLK